MTDYLTTTITDGIAHIKLDDGKANALGFEMQEALQTALDQAEKDAEALLISGREGVLSAGFNLKVMQNGTREDVIRMVNGGGEFLQRLFIFPKPVIIAATGHAMAAGALLLLAADYVIAGKGDFKIGLNETAIGMVLPQYGLELASYRLTRNAYDAAVVGAQLYDPEGAEQAGYVHEVADLNTIHEAALARAQHYQQLDAKAYKGNKIKSRGKMAEKILSGIGK